MDRIIFPPLYAELITPNHTIYVVAGWSPRNSWWDIFDGEAWPTHHPISRREYERAAAAGRPHRAFLLTSETAPGKVVPLRA